MKTRFALYRDLLVTYLRPQWPRVVWMAVLLLAGIGVQLVTPQVVSAFIDTARVGGTLQTLTRIALLYVGVVVVQHGISVLSVYVTERTGWSATNALRADLFRHCLALDMSFHHAHTPGEMIERLDGDVMARSGLHFPV